MELFITQISCGETHSAVVTSQGQIFMWGDASEGCLGRPPPESNPKQISLIPLEVDFFIDKKVS